MQGNFDRVTSISVSPRIMMEEWLHSCLVPSLPLYRLVWDQGRSTQLTWWHSETRDEASQSLLPSQHVSDIKNRTDKPRHLDMISSASSFALTLLVFSHYGFLYMCFLFVLSHWFEVVVIHLNLMFVLWGTNQDLEIFKMRLQLFACLLALTTATPS